MGPKPGNTFGHCKITSVVLVSYFEVIIIFILKCNEEQQIIGCCFLAGSILKFSTEIDIFIEHL